MFLLTHEKGWEGARYLCHIKMEMRLCSVLEMNSLLGRLKAMHATLPCPHGMTSSLRWRPSGVITGTISHAAGALSVIVSNSLSGSSLSYLSIALNMISTAFVLCAPLPSQTAKCVRQALHPFQHAVQFMRLLLQELYSLHFHPEHCAHSGLQGWKLSW